jgi:O-antigen/teichoic acid export membrane protein
VSRPVVHGLVTNGAAQAVSSLSNVLVAVIVARNVSAGDFGRFAVVLATFSIAVGCARALIGEPVLVLRAARAPGSAGGVVRAALVVGAVVGACLVPGAVLVSPPLRQMLLLLALFLPAVVVQDSLRFVWFAARRPMVALGLDVTWLGVTTGLILTLDDRRDVVVLTLCWFAGAVVSALVGTWVSGRRADHGARETLRACWPLGRRYVMEFLTAGGLAALPVYVLVALVSPYAAGGYRAAQTLLGPTNVAFAAVSSYFVPRANGLEARRGLVVADLIRLTCALACAVAVWATALCLMPVSWLAALVGDSAAGAHACLPWLAVGSTLLAVAGGAIVGHRALRAARASLRVRTVLAPAGVALPIAGAASLGLNGVLGAVVLFAALSVVVWWHSLASIASSSRFEAVAA